MRDLHDRYAFVCAAIADACRAAGRPTTSVRLLAVSKFHPVEDILALVREGQMLFGENYVQEAQAKSRVLAQAGYAAPTMLHMIGHVQRKKAQAVCGAFALVHSLDSEPLADALERAANARACVQKVLIEVNIGDEPQKAGIDVRALPAFADHVLRFCPHLELSGLMCMPPLVDAGDAARPYFAHLRELAEDLRSRTGLPLPELSMGMSGDFACAIAEGATIVRIGTALFGPRPARLEPAPSSDR